MIRSDDAGETERRAAIVPVSHEVLVEMLRMPVGSIIRDIRLGDRADVFEFKVEHPNLPIVRDGEALCRIVYTVSTDTHVCPADESVWKRNNIGKWNWR